MSHWKSNEEVTLPRWARKRIPKIEFGMTTRVGTVPLRVALLHCLYHAKEGAATQQAKMLPPGHSNKGYRSHATISASPAGFYKWGHLWVAGDIYCSQYQLALGMFICQCQDLFMQDFHNELDQWLVRAGLHSGMHSSRSQLRIRAHSCAPPWAPFSSWVQSPSPETNRHEGTTAPQQLGCNTVHPSQALSTGPVQSQECPHTTPRVEGQTHAHSLLRYDHSHRIDKLPKPLRVSTGITIPPAHPTVTSVKWPLEGSSTSTLNPGVGIHSVGADSNGGIRAHHWGVKHWARHIPRLPPGVPLGMSCLCQSYKNLSLEMSSYIALPAALNCSHTNKSPQGRELA